MTDADVFQANVKSFSGKSMNWNEEDVIFAGARDGGDIIDYLRALVKKIQKAEDDLYVQMEATESIDANIEG